MPASSKLPASTLPLHGITVLDFSHVIAGPFATFHLAALGARVIKIENPKRGDSMRSNPRSFAAINGGKEILRLDLANPDDLATARSIASTADVMVDNMRPGVLARYGLAEPQVRELNPGIVHCSISGYGGEGEWSHRAAYDHVVQAASGMSLMSGQAGEAPVKVGFPVVDSVTGVIAAFAILAALRRRDLTGLGEALDVSMMASAMHTMYPMVVETMASGQAPQRRGNLGYSGSPAADTLMCADGLLAIGANTPVQLRKLAGLLGVSAQVEPLLANETGGFVSPQHTDEIRRLFAGVAREASAAELEERLNRGGVAAARVRDLGEAVKESVQRQMIAPWTLAGETPVMAPGLGFRAKTLYGGEAQPSWARTPELP